MGYFLAALHYIAYFWAPLTVPYLLMDIPFLYLLLLMGILLVPTHFTTTPFNAPYTLMDHNELTIRQTLWAELCREVTKKMILPHAPQKLGKVTKDHMTRHRGCTWKHHCALYHLSIASLYISTSDNVLRAAFKSAHSVLV